MSTQTLHQETNTKDGIIRMTFTETYNDDTHTWVVDLDSENLEPVHVSGPRGPLLRSTDNVIELCQIRASMRVSDGIMKSEVTYS